MSDAGEDEARRLRRERRAFVAAGHPDRGGDPVRFAEGLADLDARLAAAGRGAPVVRVVRRRRGVLGALDRLVTRSRRRSAPPRVR